MMATSNHITPTPPPQNKTRQYDGITTPHSLTPIQFAIFTTQLMQDQSNSNHTPNNPLPLGFGRINMDGSIGDQEIQGQLVEEMIEYWIESIMCNDDNSHPVIKTNLDIVFSGPV